MDKLLAGTIAGLVFGVVDVLLMIPLSINDKSTAMIGSFINRFAIGFLIVNTYIPISPFSLVKGITHWVTFKPTRCNYY